jgi:hypothetical protein
MVVLVNIFHQQPDRSAKTEFTRTQTTDQAILMREPLPVQEHRVRGDYWVDWRRPLNCSTKLLSTGIFGG